jgi:hypothetical protein
VLQMGAARAVVRSGPSKPQSNQICMVLDLLSQSLHKLAESGRPQTSQRTGGPAPGGWSAYTVDISGTPPTMITDL